VAQVAESRGRAQVGGLLQIALGRFAVARLRLDPRSILADMGQPIETARAHAAASRQDEEQRPHVAPFNRSCIAPESCRSRAVFAAKRWRRGRGAAVDGRPAARSRFLLVGELYLRIGDDV